MPVTSPSQHKSRQSTSQQFFVDMWYGKRWWAWLFLPVACLYQLLSCIYHRYQKKRAISLPVPVVVVGNITVGGTGKTPVIISLARRLRDAGIQVGIISRGYGSQAPHYPYLVTSAEPQPHFSGDEPLQMARATSVPVVIDKDRIAAAQYLLRQYPNTQLILSDDGLQHYRLARDYEIIIVDGERGLGNHFCLPAGPLRESASRLASANCVLVNRSGTPKKETSPTSSAHRFDDIHVQPVAWRHLLTQQQHPLHPLPWLSRQNSGQGQTQELLAVAAIGNPQRFLNTLELLVEDNAQYSAQIFDDHHAFSEEDIRNWGARTVVMTEKDAVKCQVLIENDANTQLLAEQWWSLMIDIELPDGLVNNIHELVIKK